MDLMTWSSSDDGEEGAAGEGASSAVEPTLAGGCRTHSARPSAEYSSLYSSPSPRSAQTASTPEQIWAFTPPVALVARRLEPFLPPEFEADVVLAEGAVQVAVRARDEGRRRKGRRPRHAHEGQVKRPRALFCIATIRPKTRGGRCSRGGCGSSCGTRARRCRPGLRTTSPT
jgi:hypothetical protein